MGSKKVALILHGWPAFNPKDKYLVNYLDDKGYKVYVPDLFGPDFNFSNEDVFRQIIENLNGEKPDLIIGISFGGIILPNIAKHFPESKLMLIATSASFKPKPRFFKFLMNISDKKGVVWFSQRILQFPDNFIKILYKAGYPFKGNQEEKDLYETDMAFNIMSIKSIPASKDAELVRFAFRTDNAEILKNLKNKSIIFSGTNDYFMPESQGELLHKLLLNSKLYISSRGQHFDIFTKNDLPKVDEFLGY